MTLPFLFVISSFILKSSNHEGTHQNEALMLGNHYCPWSFFLTDAAPILNPGTGHYYDRIDVVTNWFEARTMAEGMVFMGAPGYLATLTSAQENQWVYSTFESGMKDHWLGGFRGQGNDPDPWTPSQPLENWKWVTGEPWDYTNWAAGRPAGFTALQYDKDQFGGPWWHDTFPSPYREQGFIVEFDVAPIPEPSTILLLASGLVGFVGFRWRFRKTTRVPTEEGN
jgi:hypothetical protein